MRRGDARLYTTKSTWPSCLATSSTVCSRISLEKASPLMLQAPRPAASAARSKAALLYQPADAVRRRLAGRSKNTPTVSAPQPKAATMREASP